MEGIKRTIIRILYTHNGDIYIYIYTWIYIYIYMYISYGFYCPNIMGESLWSYGDLTLCFFLMAH